MVAKNYSLKPVITPLPSTRGKEAGQRPGWESSRGSQATELAGGLAAETAGGRTTECAGGGRTAGLAGGQKAGLANGRTAGLKNDSAENNPYLRAEEEDDDGYDPYSDMPPAPEEPFQEDPWR